MPCPNCQRLSVLAPPRGTRLAPHHLCAFCWSVLDRAGMVSVWQFVKDANTDDRRVTEARAL